MFIQRPSRKAHAQGKQRETSHTVTNTTLIAAEVQFFTLLQKEINDGKFKSMKDLEESYVETMESYGITSASLPREFLKKKIKQNVQNVLITQSYGNKPPQVHSQDAAKAAINAEAARQKSDSQTMSALFKCAKDIRSLIESQLKSSPWEFKGSLKNCAGAGVPKQLLYFLTWIIQGPRTPQTPQRTRDIEIRLQT